MENPIEGYINKEIKKVTEEFIELERQLYIDFAQFLESYSYRNRNFKGETLYSTSKYDDMYLVEELFEIYKKNK